MYNLSKNYEIYTACVRGCFIYLITYIEMIINFSSFMKKQKMGIGKKISDV